MWIAVIINIPSLSHIKIKEKIRFCFSINEPLMKRRGKIGPPRMRVIHDIYSTQKAPK